eukprot:tig00000863_g4959.t1
MLAFLTPPPAAPPTRLDAQAAPIASLRARQADEHAQRGPVTHGDRFFPLHSSRGGRVSTALRSRFLSAALPNARRWPDTFKRNDLDRGRSVECILPSSDRFEAWNPAESSRPLPLRPTIDRGEPDALQRSEKRSAARQNGIDVRRRAAAGEESNEAAAPKRRGRPKKTAVEGEEALPQPEAGPATPEAPRRRGRPSKAAAPPAAPATAASSAAAAWGEAPAGAEEGAAKRRGRPRKLSSPEVRDARRPSRGASPALQPVPPERPREAARAGVFPPGRGRAGERGPGASPRELFNEFFTPAGRPPAAPPAPDFVTLPEHDDDHIPAPPRAPPRPSAPPRAPPRGPPPRSPAAATPSAFPRYGSPSAPRPSPQPYAAPQPHAHAAGQGGRGYPGGREVARVAPTQVQSGRAPALHISGPRIEESTLTLEGVRAACSRPVFGRGSRTFFKRLVAEYSEEPAASTVRGRVVGSDPASPPYEVRVRLPAERGGRPECECSCPYVEDVCKHSVALMLQHLALRDRRLRDKLQGIRAEEQEAQRLERAQGGQRAGVRALEPPRPGDFDFEAVGALPRLHVGLQIIPHPLALLFGLVPKEAFGKASILKIPEAAAAAIPPGTPARALVEYLRGQPSAIAGSAGGHRVPAGFEGAALDFARRCFTLLEPASGEPFRFAPDAAPRALLRLHAEEQEDGSALLVFTPWLPRRELHPELPPGPGGEELEAVRGGAVVRGEPAWALVPATRTFYRCDTDWLAGALGPAAGRLLARLDGGGRYLVKAASMPAFLTRTWPALAAATPAPEFLPFRPGAPPPATLNAEPKGVVQFEEWEQTGAYAGSPPSLVARLAFLYGDTLIPSQPAPDELAQAARSAQAAASAAHAAGKRYAGQAAAHAAAAAPGSPGAHAASAPLGSPGPAAGAGAGKEGEEGTEWQRFTREASGGSVWIRRYASRELELRRLLRNLRPYRISGDRFFFAEGEALQAMQFLYGMRERFAEAWQLEGNEALAHYRFAEEPLRVEAHVQLVEANFAVRFRAVSSAEPAGVPLRTLGDLAVRENRPFFRNAQTGLWSPFSPRAVTAVYSLFGTEVSEVGDETVAPAARRAYQLPGIVEALEAAGVRMVYDEASREFLDLLHARRSQIEAEDEAPPGGHPRLLAPLPPMPEGLTCTLREYQAQGVGWIRFLGRYGLGGVLADDMGLGKTVQTLATLLAHYSDFPDSPPSLVVVPTSVVYNWQHEAARFTPSLRVAILAGQERHAVLGHFLEGAGAPVAAAPGPEAGAGAGDVDAVLAGEGGPEAPAEEDDAADASLADAAYEEEEEGAGPQRRRGRRAKQTILQGLLESDWARRGLRPQVYFTTYGVVRRDLPRLRRHLWSYVILDEAQAIKNPDSATSTAVKGLRFLHALALSGTPIENRLLELYSLFDFLMPGFLGSSRRAFQDQYEKPIVLYNDPQVRGQLRKRVRPFVLRRVKEEVAKDLPPKTDIVLRVDLTPRQRYLYEQMREKTWEQLRAVIRAKGSVQAAQATVLTALMKLRQLCDDPRLVDPHGRVLPKARPRPRPRPRPLPPPPGHARRRAATAPGRGPGPGRRVAEEEPEWAAELQAGAGEGVPYAERDSGKLQALLELLESVVEEGHRVLIFSQFVGMLKLLEAALKERGYAYEYIDGSVAAGERQERVRRFNGDASIPVFLISLKAGGTGLNLTGADYVVHYDPWWNPAVEAQATDRAHRIGQTRRVFNYKLISRGTIEEKVLELQQSKRFLADDILGGALSRAGSGAAAALDEATVVKTLTEDDLERLLS